MPIPKYLDYHDTKVNLLGKNLKIVLFSTLLLEFFEAL